ncbi:hypothetical protein N9A55_01285 [Luminiphilus sp.]|nr:hypothetical protein [Luminiphilus sp.]
MGERTATQSEDSVSSEDFLDPLMVDVDMSTCQTSLAEKRRRAEQRLETLRLREELGDFDFELYDD